MGEKKPKIPQHFCLSHSSDHEIYSSKTTELQFAIMALDRFLPTPDSKVKSSFFLTNFYIDFCPNRR